MSPSPKLRGLSCACPRAERGAELRPQERGSRCREREAETSGVGARAKGPNRGQTGMEIMTQLEPLWRASGGAWGTAPGCPGAKHQLHGLPPLSLL